MRKGILLEICFNLCAGDGKHGPNKRFTLRRNAAEPGKAGSACKIQEHSFQIVVLRVCRCNKAGKGSEERVAKRTRRFLDGFMPLCRTGAYITVSDMQRNVQFGTERADKRFVAV